jgi:hypothetical protein
MPNLLYSAFSNEALEFRERDLQRLKVSRPEKAPDPGGFEAGGRESRRCHCRYVVNVGSYLKSPTFISRSRFP